MKPSQIIYRILVNAILPWISARWLHRPQGLPNSTVALEATAKSDLPKTVALPHPALSFNVGQFIPN